MTMLKPSHYRRLRGERLIGGRAAATLATAAMVGALVGVAPQLDRVAPAVAGLVQQSRQRTQTEADGTRDRSSADSSVYYSGCREARAAGAAPIYSGQPGYRPEMDGDSDGVACEDYGRGW